MEEGSRATIYSIPRELVWYFVSDYRDTIVLALTCKRFSFLLEDGAKMEELLSEFEKRVDSEIDDAVWNSHKRKHLLDSNVQSVKRRRTVMLDLSVNRKPVLLMRNSPLHKFVTSKGFKSVYLIATIEIDMECSNVNDSPETKYFNSEIEGDLTTMVRRSDGLIICISGVLGVPDPIYKLSNQLEISFMMSDTLHLLQHVTREDVINASESDYSSHLLTARVYKTVEVAIVAPKWVDGGENYHLDYIAALVQGYYDSVNSILSGREDRYKFMNKIDTVL